MDARERVRFDFVGEEDLRHAIEVDEGLRGAIRHVFSSRAASCCPKLFLRRLFLVTFRSFWTAYPRRPLPDHDPNDRLPTCRLPTADKPDSRPQLDNLTRWYSS